MNEAELIDGEFRETPLVALEHSGLRRLKGKSGGVIWRDGALFSFGQACPGPFYRGGWPGDVQIHRDGLGRIRVKMNGCAKAVGCANDTDLTHISSFDGFGID